MIIRALSMLSILAFPLLAEARTHDGVTLPDTVTVGEASLKLNGIATRKKLFVKVYVGGLYTAVPAKTEDEVVTPDTAKALTMHFVHDVPADKLRAAFKDGFTNNTKDKGASEKANIDRLLAAATDAKVGDQVTFTYQPGTGSTVTFPGGKKEMFTGKGFADAFLLVFVGKEPPTGDLKAGLLGKS
jgi:Chalcone isomerase-like